MARGEIDEAFERCGTKSVVGIGLSPVHDDAIVGSFAESGVPIIVPTHPGVIRWHDDVQLLVGWASTSHTTQHR